MTAGIAALLICIAGGLGAALRLILDGLIRDRVRTGYPVGTTVINVTGCFILGLVTGLAAHQFLPERLHLIIGTGFLGGYTTFSTATLETIRLFEDQHYVAATVNAFGALIAGTAAAAFGLGIALAVTP